ncbi:ropporin-1-like protein isoform X2 [Arapaima gigas]
MPARIFHIHSGTMPLADTMYCAQQINIPAELPDILKQFTKAAIRTQPQDVLQWAAAYFSALSRGETLPVKERLETPVAVQKKDSNLTPGLLKVLHKQLGAGETVTKEELRNKWKALCLSTEELHTLLELGDFSDQVKWMQFFALGCSVLGGSILSTLKHACEILTEDPEGGPSRIPFDTFSDLYVYLAHLDGDIPQDEMDSFLQSMQEHVNCQGGMVQPSNFTSPHRAEKVE